MTAKKDRFEFTADESSDIPLWVQLKHRMAYLIESGFYAPGDQLPTVRRLAVDLDISYNTVNRAYMDLEREGYITTRKGRGTFVLARNSVGCARAENSALDLLVDDMIKTCATAGMDDSDIVALVEKRLDYRKYGH